MCYHISVPPPDIIKQSFEYAILPDKWEHFYHHLSGFTFAKTPVITAEVPDKIQHFHWGLIPRWVKDEEQAAKLRQWCLNATCETIYEKPAFKLLNSYSIITCPANLLFEKIHNQKKRMPVIVAKENEKKWLDFNLPEKIISSLMVPFDERKMASHTISKLITSKNENANVAEVKDNFIYNELPQLFVDGF